MKTPLLSLFTVGLFGVIQPQAASAVMLNVGESVLYNFDFSTANPAPPYEEVLALFNLINLPAGGGSANLTLDFYDLPNASGTAFLSYSGIYYNGTDAKRLYDAEALDGIFSFRITLDQITGGGPLNIFSVYAWALKDKDNQSDYVRSDGVQVNAVPAPATLSLLGLGLAALGVVRRRKEKTYSV